MPIGVVEDPIPIGLAVYRMMSSGPTTIEYIQKIDWQHKVKLENPENQQVDMKSNQIGQARAP